MTESGCLIRPLAPSDQIPVMDIFNYYVENGFAAYPERPFPYEFYERMLAGTQGYPTAALESPQDGVIGFGFIKPYHPMPAFRQTAEISYFIRAEYTRLGLGNQMLNYLIAEGARIGITNILAQICSLNEPSLKFHQTHGFQECGRFLGVGQKKQTRFDVVWMQRRIA
ncbi:sortase [Longilinea arvoryzae]|uniref:Sortase n=1 Tax=Longilinea arvoryzae TaxID=360412 RepID=A0A0S7BD82_9CHLR|nr:GNAT family N-acetyltransferase [Longilinea arvoryzae]GAP15871.1 sortase [Longilinea arvoryzae]